jgi:hypothetical protein
MGHDTRKEHKAWIYIYKRTMADSVSAIVLCFLLLSRQPDEVQEFLQFIRN